MKFDRRWSSAAPRYRGDGDRADQGARDADVWRPQGAGRPPLPHVWPHHGRHEPQRRGDEARQGHQHTGGDTWPAARPPAGQWCGQRDVRAGFVLVEVIFDDVMSTVTDFSEAVTRDNVGCRMLMRENSYVAELSFFLICRVGYYYDRVYNTTCVSSIYVSF